MTREMRSGSLGLCLLLSLYNLEAVLSAGRSSPAPDESSSPRPVIHSQAITMTLVSLVTKHNLQMLIRMSAPCAGESSFRVAAPPLWG